jgi:hypothetical protein
MGKESDKGVGLVTVRVADVPALSSHFSLHTLCSPDNLSTQGIDKYVDAEM